MALYQERITSGDRLDWLDVLVLSPTPSHPQDQGNRNRINAVCSRLKDRGARIHFVYYAAESRNPYPLGAYKAMQDTWDSLHIVAPTLELHRSSQGDHHTVDEWWDPAIGDMLTWLFETRTFDVLLVNYTYLTKAFEYAPLGVAKILDTHDRFSGRKELLERNQISKEFFYTTEDQEAIALNRADVVWAIKHEEQEFFESICDVRVITVLHGEDNEPVTFAGSSESDELVIGFLGARNNINLRNMMTFFEQAIPAFRETMAPVRMKVAGGMCSDLSGQCWPGVEYMGYVQDVRDFYEDVDLVAVPIEFSTGLKIKVGEALSFGAPVIGCGHAFEGYESSETLHQLHSIKELVDACIEVAFDRSHLVRLRKSSLDARKRLIVAATQSLDYGFDVAIRDRTSIVLILDDEALVENSLIFWQFKQTAEYFNKASNIIFYCPHPVCGTGIKALSELSKVGHIVCCEGDIETACMLGARAGTLQSEIRARPIAGIYASGLNPALKDIPPDMGVPCFVRVEFEDFEMTEDDIQSWARHMASQGHLSFVAIDQQTASLACARFPGAIPVTVPFWRYNPTEWLGHGSQWDRRCAESGHVMVLADRKDSDSGLLQVILGRLRRHLASDSDITVVMPAFGESQCDSSSPGQGSAEREFCTVSPRQLLVSFRQYPRPRFIVDMSDGSDGQAVMRDLALGACIPRISVGTQTGTVGSNVADLPENCATTLGELFELIELLCGTPEAIENMRASTEQQKDATYAADAGWAALWRQVGARKAELALRRPVGI